MIIINENSFQRIAGKMPAILFKTESAICETSPDIILAV